MGFFKDRRSDQTGREKRIEDKDKIVAINTDEELDDSNIRQLTQDELKKIVAKNPEILKGCCLDKLDLSDRNLSEIDLTGTSFVGANMNNIKLRKTILKGSKFNNANLQNSDLFCAQLHNANFSKSDLTGANLSNTDLTKANLSNANLTGADLSEAKLEDCDFRNAYIVIDNVQITLNVFNFDVHFGFMPPKTAILNIGF
jgi:uncharacterized protein YjbI with pentapeptide repeats